MNSTKLNPFRRTEWEEGGGAGGRIAAGAGDADPEACEESLSLFGADNGKGVPDPICTNVALQRHGTWQVAAFSSHAGRWCSCSCVMTRQGLQMMQLC